MERWEIGEGGSSEKALRSGGPRPGVLAELNDGFHYFPGDPRAGLVELHGSTKIVKGPVEFRPR